jgi:hypothetical protein
VAAECSAGPHRDCNAHTHTQRGRFAQPSRAGTLLARRVQCPQGELLDSIAEAGAGEAAERYLINHHLAAKSVQLRLVRQRVVMFPNSTG